MIGRAAGTTSLTSLAGVRTTDGFASSGSHSSTGSSSAIRPSSTSIMSEAAVMGLVIDAMRKMDSLVIGAPPTLAEPTAATSARSPRTTRPTAPGSAPLRTCLPRMSLSSAMDPPFLSSRVEG